MIKYVHVKVYPVDEDEKQAAAANTARLRELCLVKEAADRATGSSRAVPTFKKSRARTDGKRTLRVL